MVAFYVITLMKASLSNDYQPTRAAPRETLGSGLSDRTMAALRCHFLSWEHRLWSSAGCQRLKEEMSSHAYLKGATLSHGQVLRMTDLPWWRQQQDW
jgi:hypothetical protein